MVPRINKNLLLQILAGVIVLITIFLFINKYILHNRAKSNLVKNTEHSLSQYINNKNRLQAIKENFQYTKQLASSRNQVKNNLEVILKNDEGRWVLKDSNSEYYLSKKNGQLVLVNYNQDKKFKVMVEGVGEAESSLGKAELELPTKPTAKNIKIYEQEDYLPIFGYHYVSPDNKKIEERRHFLEMHLSDFRKQISYLSNDLDCHWITFGEVMEKYIIPEKKTPRHTCVITFDDGHKDGYKYIFPVLQEFNIPATFYIISGLIGTPGYLTWQQLDEIYRQGSEVGAHTVSAEGLIKTSWFEKREHRPFTKEDLVWQITESKKQLQAQGYNTRTFAYPLGEWNQEIIDILKKDSFITARDTSRDYTTLDPRTPSVSLDPEFIWHMHYFKPEVSSQEELKNKMSYSGWWQFEDGYRVEKDNNKNIHRLSSLKDLTPKTYEVVELPDFGDSISNKFLLVHEGNFTVEIFASTGEVGKGEYSYLKNIEINIDGQPVSLRPGNKKECRSLSSRYYCPFSLQIDLKAGKHLITAVNKYSRFLRLDKFRIFRRLPLKEIYKLHIIEYKESK